MPRQPRSFQHASSGIIGPFAVDHVRNSVLHAEAKRFISKIASQGRIGKDKPKPDENEARQGPTDHPLHKQPIAAGVAQASSNAAAPSEQQKQFWVPSRDEATKLSIAPLPPPSNVNPLPQSTTKTVYYAFFGNTAILLLKGAMWLRSGSSAMMAETLHTFVDTLNQALLILGVRQSAIAPDKSHQYGYGRAAFFWGLVSALGLFWCGAGVTIFHGAA